MKIVELTIVQIDDLIKQLDRMDVKIEKLVDAEE
jgi:hypothetical protein